MTEHAPILIKAILQTSFQIISVSAFSLGSGEGNGNPLQYSCLENPMDGGAWWAIVHGVTESDVTLTQQN